MLNLARGEPLSHRSVTFPTIYSIVKKELTREQGYIIYRETFFAIGTAILTIVISKNLISFVL